MLSIDKAAKFLGVSIETLRRWDRANVLKAHRTVGNQRRYDEQQLIQFKNGRNSISNKIIIGYCRVSSSDQKNDLTRQIENVSNYCIAKGYQFKIITDIGSGLNFNKKGLKELISEIEAKKVSKIVVNYKDRLVRFGYEIIEQICVLNNVEIEIINHTEDKTYEEELVDDVLSIITVFSAKLYGSRSHKSKKIIDNNKEFFK